MKPVVMIATLPVLLVLTALYGHTWQPRNSAPPATDGTWEINDEFLGDAFTFVRVRYTSMDSPSGRRGRWARWRTDYPDSDLNFSFRLQQLTSLKVNPTPVILDLTDERLFKYPFIYLIEPGALIFSDAEVLALRHYLQNGGFLMVDDFWGEHEWDNFY